MVVGPNTIDFDSRVRSKVSSVKIKEAGSLIRNSNLKHYQKKREENLQ